MRGLEEEIAEESTITDISVELASPELRPLSKKVFVVHGHGRAREAVVRFLEQIGFEPIIVPEQANEGHTIIEIIEARGKAEFAVVLLTPNDEGC